MPGTVTRSQSSHAMHLPTPISFNSYVWCPRNCPEFRRPRNSVHFAGYTPSPDEVWMRQIARNLTDAEDGFLLGKRYMLMDRDGKFCPVFREILKNEGLESVLLPPKSPNLNAHVERFHRSLKEECLERMIFFGETSLRNAIREFLAHYHAERNHQGLGNRILAAGDEVGRTTGQFKCRERLGGLLRYYHRKAA